MVEPQNASCPKCSTVYKAEDATTKNINPTEVKSAVDNLITALTEANTSIVDSIQNIIPEAENAYKQDGNKTIGPSMEQACTDMTKDINKTINTINGWDIPGHAERLHDYYQNIYNTEAKTNLEKHMADKHQN